MRALTPGRRCVLRSSLCIRELLSDRFGASCRAKSHSLPIWLKKWKKIA